MGAFDEPPPFDRRTSPSPGRSAVAVLRAERYTGDLEGLVSDALRLVEADVRGRSVLLKPNLVEFFHGSSVNTDPRLVVATANAMPQTRGPLRRRRRRPGPSPRHRGRGRSVGAAGGARRRGPRIRRPERRAASCAYRCGAATRASPSSGCRRCSARPTWSSRCRSSRRTTGSGSRSRSRTASAACRGASTAGRRTSSTSAASRKSILDIARPCGPPGDRRRHRRHGGRRADHGRSRVARASSSSRATGRRGRHRCAPDGDGPREGRVPDGGRPLPRAGALGADRAAGRGSGAPRPGRSGRRRGSRTSSRNQTTFRCS